MGTPSGTPPGDGTRPSGADFPLPLRRPSGSSISTETLSRSSSDTSPSCTTACDPSVRQHVIRRVCLYDIAKHLHRSIDRLIYRLWGEIEEIFVFLFFFEYMYFH